MTFGIISVRLDLTAIIAAKNRPEPVPPDPYGLEVDLDFALEYPVPHFVKRQSVRDVQNHHQPEDDWRGFEEADGAAFRHGLS